MSNNITYKTESQTTSVLHTKTEKCSLYFTIQIQKKLVHVSVAACTDMSLIQIQINQNTQYTDWSNKT